MQIDVYYKLKLERLIFVYDDVVNWYFLTKGPKGTTKHQTLTKGVPTQSSTGSKDT